MLLEGKTVVVTGANGALGRVAASVAAGHGAHVIEFDLAFEADAENRYVVDLTRPEVVAGCVDTVGDIDAVLNIAGGFDMGPSVHETNAEQWAQMYRMNVETLQNMVAAVVPGMLARGRGAIVNVGALAAREGQANMGAYCAAKSTVMRLTEAMAKELRAQGINVNAVLPSIIDTPANRAAMPDADHATWVAPADLAEAMCFLASERARAIHGALLPVTGLA
ncbi:MAG: SDR family oxidoreductase [Gammaproteobacteria bacterium]|nr:SDR family oxidoreductase [Gammaproteobacteria bacterium]MCP5199888.1 SDR family oxidoreductase [Gammaproteobacteria bacterium]